MFLSRLLWILGGLLNEKILDRPTWNIVVRKGEHHPRKTFQFESTDFGTMDKCQPELIFLTWLQFLKYYLTG